jgi:glycosyltransferase involved in cell wall biosynthesis
MSKVSIVTISLNQGAFVERAIRSVLEQEAVDLEYIVVDAGSTDGSREVIEKYRPRIAKIILEPDDGPANGLNKGFAQATGEVLGYLNADDILLPGALSEAVALLERSHADVVYGDGYFIDAEGRSIRRCLSTPFNFRRLLLGAMVVMQQSTFFRARCFREVGGFNEQNHTCWDGELFFEFAKRGLGVVHVAKYWSAFRLHSGGISGSGRLEEQYQADLRRIYGPSLAEFGPRLHWHRKFAWWETRLRSPRRSLLAVCDRFLGPPDVIVQERQGRQ